MRRLSPGRTLAAIWGRIAGARYVVEDVLYVIGRFLRRLPRTISDGVATSWGRLDSRVRIGVATAIGAVAVVVVLAGIAVPNLPCQFPGGGSCPPDDTAEELVPAEALTYIHLDLDPESDQVGDASRIVTSVPTITSEVLGDFLELVPGSPIGPLDLALGAAPWFGGEAAVAVLPGGSGDGERVSLLEVDDADAAAGFVAEVTGEASTSTDHRGVVVEIGDDGNAAALLDGFLAAGPEGAVRAVIDVATGAEAASSLADDPIAVEARDELPDERFAEAFISAAGAARLIADEGALGFLSSFVSPASTRGVAVSVGAADGELELAVRSLLLPERNVTDTGIFAAFEPFEAELPERLGADSLAYVGFGDPQRTVEALLAQAAAEAPGIAEGFEGLVGELRADGQIDVEAQLLPGLGDEAAFAVEPRGGEGAGEVPFFTFLASGVDAEATRGALARLQGPIAEAIEPEVGLLAPVFQELDIDGVEAHMLPVSPAIDLTYAIVDDIAVIATDPQGVERIAGDQDGLAESAAFERATDGFPETSALLAFLDLRELVQVAERLGLAADPAYAAFAGEIRALTALGLTVGVGENVLSTDARLVVEPAADSGPPLAPGEDPVPGGDDPGILEPSPDTPGLEPPPSSDELDEGRPGTP